MKNCYHIFLLTFFITLPTACGVADKSNSDSDLSSVSSSSASGKNSKSVACAFSINGKNYEGKSEAECDKLKAELNIPGAKKPLPLPASPVANPPASSQKVSCAFSVNGKDYTGSTQAECDKLKQDLGIGALPSIPAPKIPAPAVPAPTVPAPSSDGTTAVSCAYNVNGVLHEGKTQAECDKLKQQFGVTLSF